MVQSSHMLAKKRWGGYRENAGRPLAYKTPMTRNTVTLPEPLVDFLRQLGNGNLSLGIRELANKWEPAKDVIEKAS